MCAETELTHRWLFRDYQERRAKVADHQVPLLLTQEASGLLPTANPTEQTLLPYGLAPTPQLALLPLRPPALPAANDNSFKTTLIVLPET